MGCLLLLFQFCTYLGFIDYRGGKKNTIESTRPPEPTSRNKAVNRKC